MGQPFNNARHNPTSQAVYGLIKGETYSPDIDDRSPLSLCTFGLVISDQYSNCGPAITTGYSACPGVTTGYSMVAGVTTSWGLK